MSGTPTFQGDKIELARRLVLAALEPNPGNDAIRVERLLYQPPGTRSHLQNSFSLPLRSLLLLPLMIFSSVTRSISNEKRSPSGKECDRPIP